MLEMVSIQLFGHPCKPLFMCTYKLLGAHCYNDHYLSINHCKWEKRENDGLRKERGGGVTGSGILLAERVDLILFRRALRLVGNEWVSKLGLTKQLRALVGLEDARFYGLGHDQSVG